MKSTETKNPIEYIDFKKDGIIRIILFPKTSIHFMADVLKAQSWVRRHYNTVKIAIEWQDKPDTPSCFNLRSQTTPHSSITKYKEVHWTELTDKSNRVIVNANSGGEMVFTFYTPEKSGITFNVDTLVNLLT